MADENKFYEEDAIDTIRQKMNEASSNWIKKIMRKMKIQRITDISVERMRACLAIHHYNLPITCDLLGTVLDMWDDRRRLSSFLHGLGDKGCVILKRGTKTPHGFYEWVVSPVFWKYFNAGWKEEVGV